MELNLVQARFSSTWPVLAASGNSCGDESGHERKRNERREHASESIDGEDHVYLSRE